MIYLLIPAILVLSGCAADYTWRKVAAPSKKHEWRKVGRKELMAICPSLDFAGWDYAACVNFDYKTAGLCVIHSTVAEFEAARLIGGDGEDVRTHELRHCAGWVH